MKLGITVSGATLSAVEAFICVTGAFCRQVNADEESEYSRLKVLLVHRVQI